MAEASAADRDDVIALWHACGLTRPWNDPVRDFDTPLANPTSWILIERDGGRLVASAMIGFDGHRGWVYYLAVDPERRRQGLGGRLMDAAEQWLRAVGAAKIQLMVRDTNEEALGFYAAFGLERQPVVTLGRFLDSEDPERRP